MLPFLQREPAVIAGAVIAVLNALQQFGVINLTADGLSAVNIALIAVLTLFVRQTSTSLSSPTLKANTEVSVKGTSDTVVIQPTPPGPTGVEGGADEPPEATNEPTPAIPPTVTVEQTPTLTTTTDAPTVTITSDPDAWVLWLLRVI